MITGKLDLTLRESKFETRYFHLRVRAEEYVYVVRYLPSLISLTSVFSSSFNCRRATAKEQKRTMFTAAMEDVNAQIIMIFKVESTLGVT